MNNALGLYAKALVAALLAGLTALYTALSGDGMTDAEWVTVAIAVLTAVSVYLVPNSRASDEHRL